MTKQAKPPPFLLSHLRPPPSAPHSTRGIPPPPPLTVIYPQPLHASFPPRGIVQAEGRGGSGGARKGGYFGKHRQFRGGNREVRFVVDSSIRMSLSDCEWECTSNTSGTSARGEEAFARKKAGVQKGELNSQLIEYINEWRKTREKDEEELRKLKSWNMTQIGLHSMMQFLEKMKKLGEEGKGKVDDSLRLEGKGTVK